MRSSSSGNTNDNNECRFSCDETGKKVQKIMDDVKDFYK